MAREMCENREKAQLTPALSIKHKQRGFANNHSTDNNTGLTKRWGTRQATLPHPSTAPIFTLAVTKQHPANGHKRATG